MRTKYFKKVMAGLSALDATGLPPADQVPQCSQHNVVVEFGAATTAGTIVVEEAARPDYTGTWANLATIAWSAATKAGSASVNATKAALRTRISVGVVNGTVDVYMQGLG